MDEYAYGYTFDFEATLQDVPVAELKKMAEVWGGHKGMRKLDAIAAIKNGLNDPRQVQRVVKSLSPMELTALVLLKRADNFLQADELSLMLAVRGFEKPSLRTTGYGEFSPHMLEPLVEKGLILGTVGRSPTRLSAPYSYSAVSVFADERVLEAVPVMPPRLSSLGLVPYAAAANAQVVQRQPTRLLLDVIGLWQSIEAIGGVRLTKSGKLRATDLKKIKRKLNWEDEPLDVDGMPISYFTEMMMGLCAASGLIVYDEHDHLLNLNPETVSFSQLDFIVQVHTLLNGAIGNQVWYEYGNAALYESNYVIGRSLLVTMLQQLPPDENGFFRLDDLSELMYARVGDDFSLNGLLGSQFWSGAYHQDVRVRQRQISRDRWQSSERIWLESALNTWLYALGLVTLERVRGRTVGFRLTDLGRSLWMPTRQPENSATTPVPTSPSTQAWVVQPNFDIVVYLDRVSPEQLMFLEQHTERRQVDRHMAHYHLSRTSVYQGLENGSTVAQIERTLADGAQAPLPRNIRTELKEWGQLREQISIYRNVSLLEFDHEAERDKALRHIHATPLGERLALVHQDLPRRAIHTRINYRQALPACLQATEDGELILDKPVQDLLLKTQLDRWAERVNDNVWKLTPGSIAKRAQRVTHTAPLLDFLQQRLLGSLPPLLAVALRSWAGSRISVQIAPAILVRCPRLEVFNAIRGSQKFAPYVQSTIGQEYFVIDPEMIEPFRSALEWLGLSIKDNLDIVSK